MPIKNRKYMTPDPTSLPEGQRRAVRALISGERARTYPEAANITTQTWISSQKHCAKYSASEGWFRPFCSY